MKGLEEEMGMRWDA